MLTVFVLPLTVVACGGSSGPDASKPEGALQHQIDLISQGQYGRAYDEIHPAQQALFTKDQYVACTQSRHPSAKLSKVKEVFTENVLIPGTDQHADSTAITADVQGAGLVGTSTQTNTFHEFNVNGQWRFAVDDPGLFTRGGCP